MNIVLTGYRGSGKSTVGGLVASLLQWPFIDVDREIECRGGQIMIDLYAALGEERFRDLESQVVADACGGDEQVIALGAGSLLRPLNQKCVCERSLVVYLKLAPEQLWQRIRDDPKSASTRPNLPGVSSNGLEAVVKMLSARQGAYEQCATQQLDASLHPEQLAPLIVQHLHSLRVSS